MSHAPNHGSGKTVTSTKTSEGISPEFAIHATATLMMWFAGMIAMLLGMH